MKKLYLLTLATFFIRFLFSQIPNSGMENWTTERLDDWETNSCPFCLPPYNSYVVVQDTDSYSGTYAADLIGNNVFKPYAKVTLAVSTHPNHLTLYTKLIFPPCINDTGNAIKDTASVLIELLNQGRVVDNGYWESTTSHSTYTRLIVPMSQNASVFDSCRITIMGGIVFGGCGFVAAATEFVVDQLELSNSCIDSSLICHTTCVCPQIYFPVCGCDSQTYANSCYAENAGVSSYTSGACTLTGIISPGEDEPEMLVFPVPASQQLTVKYKLNKPGKNTLRINNLLGQTVFTRVDENYLPDEIHTVQVDLSGFTNGVYFVAVENASENMVMKFVKE